MLLLVLLVLAIAGLVVALATRTSSTTSSDGPFDGTAYVAANRAIPNGNSVLALRYLNGSLTPLRIREYATRGAGGTNLKLLANDADGQVATNDNHTLLFVVNQGSDTIAVFHIASDGTLSPVKGSPFGSGGSAPVSIAVHGNTAVVVNKAADGVRELATVAPTIVTFKINEDGSLTQVGACVLDTQRVADQALLDPSGTVLLVPELVKGDLLTLTRGPDGAFHQAGQSMITAQQASFTAPPAKPPPLPQVPGISITPPGSRHLPEHRRDSQSRGSRSTPSRRTSTVACRWWRADGVPVRERRQTDVRQGRGEPGRPRHLLDGRDPRRPLPVHRAHVQRDGRRVRLADPANPRFIGKSTCAGPDQRSTSASIRPASSYTRYAPVALLAAERQRTPRAEHWLGRAADRGSGARRPPVTANPSPPSLVQPYGLILVPHT